MATTSRKFYLTDGVLTFGLTITSATTTEQIVSMVKNKVPDKSASYVLDADNDMVALDALFNTTPNTKDTPYKIGFDDNKTDDGVISELRTQWAEFKSEFSKHTNVDKGTTTNENMFRKSVMLRDQNKCVLTNTAIAVDACHLVPKSESEALLALGFTCIYDVRLGFALAHQFHSDFDKKHMFAIHPQTLRVILAPNTPKGYPLTENMVANLKPVTPHQEVSFPTKHVLELAYYAFVQYWANNGTNYDENGKILSKKRKDKSVYDGFVVAAFSKYKKQKQSDSDEKKPKAKKPAAKKDDDDDDASEDEKSKKKPAAKKPAKKKVDDDDDDASVEDKPKKKPAAKKPAAKKKVKDKDDDDKPKKKPTAHKKKAGSDDDVIKGSDDDADSGDDDADSGDDDVIKGSDDDADSGDDDVIKAGRAAKDDGTGRRSARSRTTVNYSDQLGNDDDEDDE